LFFIKEEKRVLKNTYSVLLLVVFIAFSTLTVAESVSSTTEEFVPLTVPSREKPFTPEQADFFTRSAAARQLWDNSLILVNEFIKGLGLKEDKNRSLDSIVEGLQENYLVVLTLVKYFSVTELDKFVELSSSSEIHLMVSKMSKKIAGGPPQLRLDIESLVYEFKTALRRAKKQLGKTTEEVSPIPRLEQLPTLTDKSEVIKKLMAARQLLTSCLPLIEDLVRRQFNLEFKTVEGSKVSIAVKSVVESLTENPTVILILARHFEAKELKKMAEFLDTMEVRDSVATVSRQLFVAEGGQFQLDLERVRQEIEMLYTPIRENLRDKFPQFFVEEKPTKGKESGSKEQATGNMNPAKKANGLEKLKILLPTESMKKDKVEGEGDKTGLESGKSEGTAKGKSDGKQEKSTTPLPGESTTKGKSRVEAEAKTGNE
jgi:hypothetical protein